MGRKDDLEKRAAFLLGKYVLVGVTECDAAAEPVKSWQVHGTVTSVSDGLVKFALAGLRAGDTFTLPLDIKAFEKADPEDIYRLRSTGEEIAGVDYTTTWDVLHFPDKGDCAGSEIRRETILGSRTLPCPRVHAHERSLSPLRAFAPLRGAALFAVSFDSVFGLRSG